MNEKVRPYLPLVLIAALVFIVYANTLGNGFVYDDYPGILTNPALRDAGNLSLLFRSGYFRMAKEASYRPVVTLTYFLDYRLWGLKAGGYHLTNILLHALNAVLVYLFLRDRLKKPGVALAASLLFALHPVASEAVNGISFREDLLALFFGLLALLAYERAPADSRGRGRYLGGFLAAFFLALFAKEEALILPGLILLLEICFGRDFRSTLKRRAPFYLGMLAVLGFYLLVRFALLRSPQEEGFTPVPLPARLLTESKVIFFYLGLLLFPLRLSVEYVYPISVFLREPGVLFSILGLLVILLAMIRYHRRYPGPVFGAGWFFLALLPAADIFPLFNQVAERYLYFPLAGFCLLAALAGEAVYARLRAGGKHLLMEVLVAVLVLFSLRTFIRNRDWKDCLTLYEKTVQTCPDSSRFYNNLGTILKYTGRLDEAERAYKQALEINPDSARNYYNLADLYEVMDRKKEAKSLYERALKIKPDFTEAYNNLGLLDYEEGKTDEAVSLYRRALEIDPGFAKADYNLGIALENQGDLKQAIDHYRKAISAEPYLAEAYNNLGSIYFRQGNNAEALACFRKAVKIKPDYAVAYNNLGSVYSSQGKKTEAADFFKKASALDSKYLEALRNLASVSEELNRKEEAVAALKKAAAIDPGDDGVHSRLGDLYFALGRKEEAAAAFEKAVELKPTEAGYNNLGAVYVQMNRKEEAIAAFKKAVGINPAYAGGYNNLGILYGSEGRPTEAIEFFRKAVEINPGFADAHYNLAMTYGQAGRREEALVSFKKVVEIAPGNAAAHYRLALLYHRSGQTELAARHAARAVDLGYPISPELRKLIDGDNARRTRDRL